MTQVPKHRKKRDTSGKRKIILEGAIKVFIEKGYDTSSMDTIAETAGVSKRTIYNHFASKEILFQAIVGDFLKQRDEIMPISYSKEMPISEQLKHFAEAQMYLINDPVRRGLSKLLASVFLMDVPLRKATKSQHSSYKSFIDWLLAAKDHKQLDFVSPELPARIFYGMVEGCITWPALYTDGESLNNTEDQLDEIIQVFLSHYGK